MTSENPEKAKLDTDFAKKVETDTLTKALSKLGFSADVFLSKFEDITEVKIENEATDILTKIKACETVAQVIQLYNKNKTQIDGNTSIKSVWSARRQALMEGKK
jgi:disulfide oxidoreductase YuzD